MPLYKKVGRDNSNQKKNVLSNINESYRQFAPYLGLGTQMVVTILLLTFLGKYADDHYQTKPLYTVIGALLGATAGFYTMIRSLLSLFKKDKKSK